jgi:two-component system response regulator EvgA
MRHQIFIIEDHPDFALALALLFGTEDRFQVCGVAHDIPAALLSMQDAGAHLVTVDVNLPSGSGLEQISRFQTLNPVARFLAFSNEEPMRYSPIARDAGASGYLRKGATPRKILEVADLLLGGGEYFPGIPARAWG